MSLPREEVEMEVTYGVRSNEKLLDQSLLDKSKESVRNQSLLDKSKVSVRSKSAQEESGEDKSKSEEETGIRFSLEEGRSRRGSDKDSSEKEEERSRKSGPLEGVLKVREKSEEKRKSDFAPLFKDDEHVTFEKQPGKDVRFVGKEIKELESEFETLPDNVSAFEEEYQLPEIKEIAKKRKSAEGVELDMELAEGMEPEAEEVFLQKFEPDAELPLDREYYYRLHAKLLKVGSWERLKNNYLHQKIATYFKKRRMEHVFKEDALTEHHHQKYGRKLDALEELMLIDFKERSIVNGEVKELENLKEEKLRQAEELYGKMQKHQLEATKGMTYAKSGNALSDKAVEIILKRQRKKSELLTSCRLSFFKIKTKLRKKQEFLRTIDDIGSHLHLIDYEQLKEDNKVHSEKLDERETELTRLRSKCNSIMQMMAHIREKSAYLAIDWQNLVERLNDVDIDMAQARQHAAFMKNSRDSYRLMTQKLKEDNAIIMHEGILIDISETTSNVEKATKTLSELKENYENKCKKIKMLQKKLDKLNNPKDFSGGLAMPKLYMKPAKNPMKPSRFLTRSMLFQVGK